MSKKRSLCIENIQSPKSEVIRAFFGCPARRLCQVCYHFFFSTVGGTWVLFSRRPEGLKLIFPFVRSSPPAHASAQWSRASTIALCRRSAGTGTSGLGTVLQQSAPRVMAVDANNTVRSFWFFKTTISNSIISIWPTCCRWKDTSRRHLQHLFQQIS